MGDWFIKLDTLSKRKPNDKLEFHDEDGIFSMIFLPEDPAEPATSPCKINITMELVTVIVGPSPVGTNAW